MEQLVNAVKEGFKSQNNFLANMLKGNNQTQQGLTNQLQTIPLNQIQQVRAQVHQTQTQAQSFSPERYAQNFPQPYQLNQPPIFNIQQDPFKLNNMR